MANVHAHRAIYALVASTITAVTIVACGASGTPQQAASGTPPQAQTSSSPAAASSVSAPVSSAVSRPPTATPSVAPTPTATLAPTSTTDETAPSTTDLAETTGPSTDLAGEVYGRIVSVDPEGRQLNLDKYDWFTGDAALQACVEDGVTEHDNGWCTDYYYRNRNARLRVLAVSPDATVTTLIGGSPNEVSSDLATVAQRIAGAESSGLFRITVDDGQVTSVQELYFP